MAKPKAKLVRLRLKPTAADVELCWAIDIVDNAADNYSGVDVNINMPQSECV
jgi:hypothetical protein